MSTQNKVGTFDENILLFLDFREKTADFLSYIQYVHNWLIYLDWTNMYKNKKQKDRLFLYVHISGNHLTGLQNNQEMKARMQIASLLSLRLLNYNQVTFKNQWFCYDVSMNSFCPGIAQWQRLLLVNPNKLISDRASRLENLPCRDLPSICQLVMVIFHTQGKVIVTTI